eukprot:1736526-Prymnesium_polylepis.2
MAHSGASAMSPSVDAWSSLPWIDELTLKHRPRGVAHVARVGVDGTNADVTDRADRARGERRAVVLRRAQLVCPSSKPLTGRR